MITCPHCKSEQFVCTACGSVFDSSELEQDTEIVRPFDLAYYDRLEKDITFVDSALVDRVFPYIRPSSAMVILFMLNNSKGGSYTAWEEGFTFPELMEGTGIKSTGTMYEALAELSTGRPATKTREAIEGWDLVTHTNKHKKSKYVRGNRWKLNTEKILEGVPYKLFNAGKHGNYFMMHRKIINDLFPTMTPNQVVIFVFIYRLTIGWQREESSITYNYFTGARRDVDGEPAPPPKRQSGLSSYGGVKSALRQLAERQLIFVKEAEDPRYGKIYSLNKNIFVIVEPRERLNPASRQIESPSREMTPASRQIESPSREMTPLYSSLLNGLSENESETPLLNTPAPTVATPNTHSLPLHEKAEKRDKLPLSEQPPAFSRTARESILRNMLGMSVPQSIKKALDMMDSGETTDSELNQAIEHKTKFPNAADGGVYACFLTKKKKKDGTAYELIDMDTPSVNPSEPNQSDTAPKSPPPPSDGAAHYSPAPPLDPNQRIWNNTVENLRRQMTRATFSTHFQKTELRGVNDGNFVVAVAPDSVDWLNIRLNETVQRTLRSEGQNDTLTVCFVPLKVNGATQ